MKLLKLPIEIDEEMAPLIKEINKAGLRTKYCCAGHDNTPRFLSISLENIINIDINNDKGHLHISWLPNKISEMGEEI